MEYGRLGTTGMTVSRAALGCMSFGDGSGWTIDEEASRALVKRALDLGITFFDTSNSYSKGMSEAILGRAIKDFEPRRDRLVIATKVLGQMFDDKNSGGLSRKNIMQAIDASLRRLGTDHVDLYQIHRFDPATPIEETIEALNDLVRAGKVLYVGASNMWAWQFHEYLNKQEQMGMARFVTMQNHYNLLFREDEREMLPLCVAKGIGVIPFGPLAKGMLARTLAQQAARETARTKIDRMQEQYYHHDCDAKIINAVEDIAQKRGVTMAQVSLAWMLQRPALTAPLVGATKLQHVEDAAAATALKLDDAEMKALNSPYQAKEIVTSGLVKTYPDMV